MFLKRLLVWGPLCFPLIGLFLNRFASLGPALFSTTQALFMWFCFFGVPFVFRPPPRPKKNTAYFLDPAGVCVNFCLGLSWGLSWTFGPRGLWSARGLDVLVCGEQRFCPAKRLTAEGFEETFAANLPPEPNERGLGGKRKPGGGGVRWGGVQMKQGSIKRCPCCNHLKHAACSAQIQGNHH